jgi:hypothetical protein
MPLWRLRVNPTSQNMINSLSEFNVKLHKRDYFSQTKEIEFLGAIRWKSFLGIKNGANSNPFIFSQEFLMILFYLVRKLSICVAACSVGELIPEGKIKFKWSRKNGNKHYIFASFHSFFCVVLKLVAIVENRTKCCS